jgi:hypothetical protein
LPPEARQNDADFPAKARVKPLQVGDFLPFTPHLAEIGESGAQKTCPKLKLCLSTRAKAWSFNMTK